MLAVRALLVDGVAAAGESKQMDVSCRAVQPPRCMAPEQRPKHPCFLSLASYSLTAEVSSIGA